MMSDSVSPKFMRVNMLVREDKHGILLNSI